MWRRLTDHDGESADSSSRSNRGQQHDSAHHDNGAYPHSDCLGKLAEPSNAHRGSANRYDSTDEHAYGVLHVHGSSAGLNRSNAYPRACARAFFCARSYLDERARDAPSDADEARVAIDADHRRASWRPKKRFQERRLPAPYAPIAEVE